MKIRVLVLFLGIAVFLAPELHAQDRLQLNDDVNLSLGFLMQTMALHSDSDPGNPRNDNLRDRDQLGTIKRYATLEAGGADGRKLVVELQDLHERRWARICIVHAASSGEERYLARLWFDPSALGPLIESLGVLAAAVELEGT